jgi:D-ornithine 4,5-aminomutase subunit alpha
LQTQKRDDNYQEKRENLKNLSDAELKERFWELGEKIVEPLLTLGYDHTTPSIERSVLLRMGFSSVESMAIVNEVLAKGLISKGAGNVVYRLAKHKNMSIRDAGLALYNNELWDEALALFKEGAV